MPSCRRLVPAFALVLALALPLAGCGREDGAGEPPTRSPFVGTWVLDPESTFEQMQKAGMLVGLEDVKATTLTIEMRVDGTYEGNLRQPGVVTRATGTWKAEEDDLTLTALQQNGKPADPPVTKTGVVRGGKIWFDRDDQTAPLVLRRR